MSVKTKTSPWDSAEYLTTEEHRLGLLLACLEEAPEDAALFTHAVGIVARSRNMSQIARDTGLTREGLYKALTEFGNPNFGTVWKVLHALGYRLTVEPIKRPAAKKAAARKAPAPSKERIAAKRAKRPATKSSKRKP